MTNVIDYYRRTIREYPDKIAFVDKKISITYRELSIKANALASEIIRKTGGVKNKPIAISMIKSVDMIVAFLAVAISGNFYSPIDMKMPISRVKTILEVLEPLAIIESKDSDIDCEIKISYEEGIKSKIDETLLELQQKKIIGMDPLYVLFTSGSTGVPKGVVVSHAGVIDYIEWVIDTFEFSADTVFGNQAPFYFDNSILDIYSSIFTGAETVIIDDKYFSFSNELFDFLIKYNVNTIFWVPSALIGVANSGIFEKDRQFPKLKKILFCGEVMPTKQLGIWMDNYIDVQFANLYGPTEITDVCTYFIVDRKYGEDEVLPIGKACRNTEILLLNDDGKLVEKSCIGEICVRGIGVAKGYYKNVAKTNDVFVQNPLHLDYIDYIYKTGDLAKYDENDNLIYIGRKDNQVKIQGHRIELGEIEAIANNIENINCSCAVLSKNNILYLVLAINEDIELKVIYKELKNKLPRYMMPKRILKCNSMPLNANGKIDRIRLKGDIDEENFEEFIKQPESF